PLCPAHLHEALRGVLESEELFGPDAAWTAARVAQSAVRRSAGRRSQLLFARRATVGGDLRAARCSAGGRAGGSAGSQADLGRVPAAILGFRSLPGDRSDPLLGR